MVELETVYRGLEVASTVIQVGLTAFAIFRVGRVVDISMKHSDKMYKSLEEELIDIKSQIKKLKGTIWVNPFNQYEINELEKRQHHIEKLILRKTDE